MKFKRLQSLRVFLFFTATVALGLILYFSINQTESALKNSYASLRQEHLGNVSAVVESAIESKRQELVNMGQIIRADNDLSTSYILAHESQNWELIQSKIATLKSRVNFDWVGILSLSGRPTYDKNFPTLTQTETRNVLNSMQETTRTFYHRGILYLAALSPIRLYDKPVGILILGFNLDYLANSHLGPLTKSRIQFYDSVKIGDEKLENRIYGLQIVSQASYDKLIPIRISKNDLRSTLFVDIKTLENPDDSISETLGFKLLLLGAFCLATLILSFSLVLDLVFIRPFKTIIEELNAYTKDIAQGKIRSLKLPKFLISENKVLSSGFEKLSETILTYNEELKEKAKIEAEAKKSKAVADLASQVAHDIRSPLAALEIAIKLMPEIAEDKRLLVRGAVTRIRDIANDLLSRYKKTQTSLKSTELVSSVLESIVSEKRLQYSAKHNIEIDLTLDAYSYGHFALINTNEFKRVISNLINNSVEAIGEKPGTVSVRVLKDSITGNVVTRISDSGPGIPNSVLENLGQKGFTLGKSDGYGLGLHHAKQTIESWGGTLSIESKLGLGTLISIELKACPPAKWFLSELRMKPKQTIVVIDDDFSIHQLWEKRFNDLKDNLPELSDIKVTHFSDTVSLENFVRELTSLDNILFLIDYEFKRENTNGLELIRKLNISEYSVLVTSRFEEDELRDQSEKINLNIIPKGIAGFVPLKLSQQDNISQKEDLSSHIRFNWQHSLNDKGFDLKS